MTRSELIARLATHFPQLTAKDAELAVKAIRPNPVLEHIVFCAGSLRAHVGTRHVQSWYFQ
jgi:hypothetical protein